MHSRHSFLAHILCGNLNEGKMGSLINTFQKYETAYYITHHKTCKQNIPTKLVIQSEKLGVETETHGWVPKLKLIWLKFNLKPASLNSNNHFPQVTEANKKEDPSIIWHNYLYSVNYFPFCSFICVQPYFHKRVTNLIETK